MADVLAFIDDIFFQSKLLGTSKHVGVTLATCTSIEALAEQIRQARPRLLIVDLNARADPFEAIRLARREAAGVPLVAFLPHGQSEWAARARAAGVVELLARSRFTEDLATILSRAKSEM